MGTCCGNIIPVQKKGEKKTLYGGKKTESNIWKRW